MGNVSERMESSPSLESVVTLCRQRTDFDIVPQYAAPSPKDIVLPGQIAKDMNAWIDQKSYCSSRLHRSIIFFRCNGSRQTENAF